MTTRRLAPALGFFLLCAPTASADPIEVSRAAWDALVCSHYALLFDDKEAAKQHFDKGHTLTLQFLADVAAGNATRAAILRDAPFEVWASLYSSAEGQTAEFVAGRLYELAATGADVDVRRMDAAGNYLSDSAKWLTDSPAIAERARALAAARPCGGGN